LFRSSVLGELVHRFCVCLHVGDGNGWLESSVRTFWGTTAKFPFLNWMTITDEKDKQVYALSGNTAGIKPGDRMKLQGKKVKSKVAEKTLVWEAKAVAKDFGVSEPQK
jgi:hypothetical protein